MVELFKDGDSMAIRTDAIDEGDFSREFAMLLDRLISEEEYAGDWFFQLDIWLPQYVELCCAFRGYTAAVDRTIVMTAGRRIVNSEPTHTSEVTA